MVFSLIFGVILGGMSVVFALQNSAAVTVQFMGDDIPAPLALVLLGTILSGVLMTLFVLMPSLIRDEMYLKAIKRQKRELEDEYAKYRTSRAESEMTSEPQPAVQ